jgi:hypothetical protein
MSANQERLASLRTGDLQTARFALRDVVADLNMMLNTVSIQIRRTTGRHRRAQIRKILNRDIAVMTAAELPLREITTILDLSPEQTGVALQFLRERGAIDPTTREEAIRQIRFLRDQLRLAESTEDHSLLSMLIQPILKLFHAFLITGVSAAAEELIIGGIKIPVELFRSAVEALVALALEKFEKNIRGHKHTAIAKRTLESLESELEDCSKTLCPTETYAFEWAISRTRLLVRTCTAQLALIDIDWAGKQYCWDMVGEVFSHISHSAKFDANQIDFLLRRVRSARKLACSL